MPAYAILDVEIHDIEQYMQFMQAVRPLIEAAGGHYLARGGEFEVYEGSYQPRQLVLIEFPTMEAADGFYHSEAHQQLKQQRDACSESNLVIVQGLPGVG